MRPLARVLSVVIATVTLAGTASAQTLNFSLSGPGNYFWSLPASPVVASTSLNAFLLTNVAVTFNSVANMCNITFYASPANGGLILICPSNPSNSIGVTGPQLFTGGLASPTFTVGDFAVTQFPSVPWSLSIKDATQVPVPEPTSLALLGTGLLGLVTVMRRRSQRAQD